MRALAEAVPMRWLCGALDSDRRRTQDGPPARSEETLRRWLDPSLLSILRGTPVNCLVVSWAAGLPADSEHQKSLIPLVNRGISEGLSIVGIVQGETGLPAAMESAGKAGLTAVIAAGAAPAGLPVVPLAPRPHLAWGSSSPVLAATSNVWPGIASDDLGSQGSRAGEAAEAAGPTADPWIDSNGWFLRLAKAYAPSKKIWLLFEPPARPELVPTVSYRRALADAGSCGGRWVLILDETLRAGLARQEGRALDSWRAIIRSLAFFESRRQWLDFEPMGAVGVISDFAGPNELVGTETLNLLARRSLPFRILPAGAPVVDRPGELKALICADEALPPPGVRQHLLSFVRQGGVLLASEAWKDQGGAPLGIPHPRLEFRALGKGKLAVCKSSSPAFNYPQVGPPR